MEKSKIYCFGIHDDVLDSIQSLNYIPVGLGENTKKSGWLKDNTGDHISFKNKYYSELTFYYWLWKNDLYKLPNDIWIGFSQYRRHWRQNNEKLNQNYILKDEVLHKIPDQWNNFDTILPNEINIQGLKFMKVIKSGKFAMLKNLSAIFRKNRNIKFNFDMMHGVGNLEKAINLLDEQNKHDFMKYVQNKTSLSPANMFICKKKEKIREFFDILFPWLLRCEKVFGFDLKGYGKVRMYAFLCERFLPFWFNKNTNVLKWPIIFHDLRN